MGDLDLLRKNIKALRLAYGETLEELGDSIHLVKSAIGNYEAGTRTPDNDILKLIAAHYSVTVEQLTTIDFSDVGKITIDPFALYENIGTVLPIAISDRALSNEAFKKAYHLQLDCFEKIKKHSVDSFYQIDECIDYYFEAYDCKEAKEEAAINLLGLLLFIMMEIKSASIIMSNNPASLIQAKKSNNSFRKMVNRIDPDYEIYTKEAAKDFESPEFIETLSEIKKTAKHSSKWSDLADYYLALQYCWNLVDNGLSRESNGTIGMEMLETFISVGNPYAARYYLFSLRAVGKKV